MKAKYKSLNFIFLWISIIFLFVSGCKSVDEPVFGQTVKDVDGNVYHTVTIGTQTWMIENLRTTHYTDSTPIPMVADSAKWTNLVTSGYCWYNNDSTTYGNTYGALYNWYAVDTRMLAPKGWRIPTDDDWLTLEQNAAVYYYITASLAKILATTTHWRRSGNSGAIGNMISSNNSSGFAALPGGCRINNKFSFSKIDSVGVWWSSNQADSVKLAWTLTMKNDQNALYRGIYAKWHGYSVRCIKDN